MRYFAGMTESEVASHGSPTRTVRRDWQTARLLLAESLSTATLSVDARERQLVCYPLSYLAALKRRG